VLVADPSGHQTARAVEQAWPFEQLVLGTHRARATSSAYNASASTRRSDITAILRRRASGRASPNGGPIVYHRGLTPRTSIS
jgi:hypothetical protein